jgi:hypothetical protein
MRTASAGLFALLLVTACGKKNDEQQAPPAAEPPPHAAAAAGGNVGATQPATPPAAATVSMDGEGSGNGEGNKWRDSAVYVDGVPIAVMWYGELPARLKPVWKDELMTLDSGPGHTGPTEKKIKIRRYNIVDYLEALNIDLRKVKEAHIYAPSGYPGILSGKELLRVRKGLQFAFGRETTGKPLIYFPADIQINTTFDHIGAICLYIDKQPPTLTEDGSVLLDGKSQAGIIPYYGEPLRGGIRIYKDDRLAYTIKRKKLQEAMSLSFKGENGELRWNLFQFLGAQKVDTADITAAETVERDLRGARLDRQQLEGAWFTAHPSASGQILLGSERTPVEALMLYTRPLPPRTK